MLYAHRLGARVDDAAGVLRRLRLVPYSVPLVLLLIGIVRAAPASGFGAGLAQGAAAGGALALLALA